MSMRETIEKWLMFYVNRYIAAPEKEKVRKAKIMGKIEVLQNLLNHMDGIDIGDEIAAGICPGGMYEK